MVDAVVGSESERTQALCLLRALGESYSRERLLHEYGQLMGEEEFRACCEGRIRVMGKPYPWQGEFHSAGIEYRERALICPNQVGKSRSCGAETAIHVTGRYPDWWEGHRFTSSIRACVGSQTNESLRDVVQLELWGPIKPGKKEPSGTGWVPELDIVEVSYRQCGMSGVFDEVKVRHKSGGISTIKHKTYAQGWEVWQGTQYDWYWLDEEPEDETIYSEALRGMVTRDGKLVLSRTPLLGMTWVIKHFLQPNEGASVYTKNVTWDEAPHLSEESKRGILASVPEHERDAREKGIPMMGEGAIYPVSDAFVGCDRFAIPKYYRRIAGIDFGVDHPTAGCWLAYDADRDIIFVYDVYRQRRQTIATHAEAFNARGAWIPVSWPHDGMQSDRSGSGLTLKKMYENCYVNMTHMSARYDDEKGGAQAREPIIQECYERMVTGRLKVFNDLNAWFEEKRLYHRKDGKVVDTMDDILSAMHYAVMMLRYARNELPKRVQEYSHEQDPLKDFCSSAR